MAQIDAPNYHETNNPSTSSGQARSCNGCQYGQFSSVCLEYSFKCAPGHTCDSWKAANGPLALKDFSIVTLPSPHGYLVWRGKQTAIASPDKLPTGKVLILSDGEAYGLATLSQPAQMALSEFSRPDQAEKHRIREEERQILWPEAQALYVYSIKSWTGFSEPQPIIDNHLSRYEPDPEEIALIEKARRLPKTITLQPDAVCLTDGAFTTVSEARTEELSVILQAVYGPVKYRDGKGNSTLPLYDLALVRQPALRLEKTLSRVLSAEKAHSGVMVAFMLPAAPAAKLALRQDQLPEGGSAVAPDELHLTLIYLGKKDELTDRDLIERVLAVFAANQDPLIGKVGGIGRFSNLETDGTNAFYASFDSPALPEFRQGLVEALASAGVSPPSAHGFTPHITLAYLPAGAEIPNLELPAIELAFTDLCLAWGDEYILYPLSGLKKKKLEAKAAMPYKIEKQDGGACVVNSETGEAEQCYEGDDAMEQAQALLAALSMNVEDAEAARKPKKKPMKDKESNEGEKRSLKEMEHVLERFRTEFCDDHDDYRNTPWPADVTDDNSVIASWQGGLYKVPFSQIGGHIIFASRFNWQPVTVSYIPSQDAMAMKSEEKPVITDEGITQQDNKAFDDSPWDGAASNWETAEAYCSDCLIDVNSGPEKVKGNCKLPYRKPGATNPNINALRTMASGRGITGVTKPADVSQEKWDSQLKAAANKLIGWWPDAFDKPAPDSIYQIAGKEPPEKAKAGRRLAGSMMDKLRTAMQMIHDLMIWGDYADEMPEEPEEEEMPMDMMMVDMLKGDSGVAVKMVDGEPWHCSWSSNAFQDRDGETFSQKSLERYVQENGENEVKGYFNLWHIKNTDFAEKRFQAVIGKFLFEAGPYLKDYKGKQALAFFRKHKNGHPEIAPEGWGASVEYKYLPEEREQKVYEWVWITRTSTLARGAAANIWTKSSQEEFMMNDEQKKAAEALFGKEFTEGLIAQGKEKTQALEEAGVASKTAAVSPGGDEPEPPAKETINIPAPEAGSQPVEADLNSLAAKMLEGLNATLAPTLAALQQQLTTQGEQMTTLANELKALKGEQALKQQAELPRFVFEGMRASQAAQTVVAEGDALKDKKPAETIGRTDGSMASHFFPSAK